MLWCAKEAAAKAEGSGLGGRPRQWTVAEGPAGLRVSCPEGSGHTVRTTTVLGPSEPDRAPETFVVAWTVPAPTPTHRVTPTPTEAGHGI